MPPISRFRQQAERCLMLARETENPGHRLTLLEMAQFWFQLADKAQENNDLKEADQGSGTDR
jgi:hypothetical protein